MINMGITLIVIVALLLIRKETKMKYGIYFAYWENEWDASYKKYISKYITKVKSLGLDVLEISCAALVSLKDKQLLELKKAAIPFEHHKKLDIYYEGKKLRNSFISDFVCFQKIILEIESVQNIQQSQKQEVINHLRSTECQIGLLINFGEKSLTWKRFINT